MDRPALYHAVEKAQPWLFQLASLRRLAGRFATPCQNETIRKQSARAALLAGPASAFVSWNTAAEGYRLLAAGD